jgi:predicted GNAT superfamily acetyltransferase
MRGMIQSGAMPAQDDVRVAEIRDPYRCAACEEIERRAFGYADIDIVPKNELVAIMRSGGLVLGAFEGRGEDEGAALVGFCFGFLGRDAGGALYHSSRMVAVLPEWRRRGLAWRLKMAQREAVLAQGVGEIRWTFDPKNAANATFNLHKLGAVARGYVVDYYGRTREGKPTDRLEVTWRLERPRIEAPPGGERIESASVDLRERFERALARGLAAVDFAEGAYLLGSPG